MMMMMMMMMMMTMMTMMMTTMALTGYGAGCKLAARSFPAQPAVRGPAAEPLGQLCVAAAACRTGRDLSCCRSCFGQEVRVWPHASFPPAKL